MTGSSPRLVAGLCSVTFRALDIDDVARVAARAGLAAVEWGADVHVPPGDGTATARAVAASAAAGLRIVSYGSYLAAGRGTAEEVDRVVATAVDLGAPNVRVWCPWGLTPAGAEPGDRSRVAAWLTGVCDRAADAGLTVSLEHHANTLTERASSTLALLAETGAANLRTYWQPVAGLSTAERLAELGALVDHLSHVHVFHWDDDGTRHPLAAGADLWPAALAVAARADPSLVAGPRAALLEFVADDDPERLAADAATLRRWLDDLGDGADGARVAVP